MPYVVSAPLVLTVFNVGEKWGISAIRQTFPAPISATLHMKPFISIMNLEPTGWAKHNWESLYLEPSSYLDVLTRSVSIAENCGVHVSLFNYPLCHISSELRPYAVKSISDWKNYYPNYCSSCSQRDLCTGFFASSIGKYHHPPEELL